MRIQQKTIKQLKHGIRGSYQQELTEYTEPTKEKHSYAQESWPRYEKVRSQEKLLFMKILHEAVESLNIPQEYHGNGRPSLNISDIIKSLCIKVFGNYSSWNLHSELVIAKSMGIIQEIYSKSSLNKYMKDPRITPWLERLFLLVAEPLKELETSFAVDSTGMSTFNRDRWVEVRLEHKKHKDYKKLHIVSGTKTHVIVAAKITEGTSNDSPYFKPLLDDTAKMFTIKEVSADSAYLSMNNVNHASELGAKAFIMPKKNTKTSYISQSTAGWGKMIKLWRDHRFVFANHYHRRSNVESTFAMLKRKYGFYVRGKCFTSIHNEILCKIICHNISVLNEALLTYDLAPSFMVT